jgi:GNAT superfamily N-acetyltransferase
MAFKMAEERVLHNAKEFYIRKANPSEKEALHEMFKKYIDKKWWAPSENALTLVAVEKKNGRVIGGIEREVDMKECCAEGSGLVILPEFQGKGIGGLLVQAIDSELREMGIKHITIIAGSEGAWKIFTKNGYRYPPDIKANLKKDGIPEDKFVKPVLMVREVKDRVLHDSEKFFIREAHPEEVEVLLKMLKKEISGSWIDRYHNAPGKKVTLVAIDKETNQLIGGIERVVDIEFHNAVGVGFTVSKKFRSKGIGTTLLEVIDGELKEMGVKCITTVAANKKAWEFLRKNGYENNDFVKAYLNGTGRSDRFVGGMSFAEMEKHL